MKWLEDLLHPFAGGQRLLNEKIIEHLASATKPRPHAFSLWGATPPSQPAHERNPASVAAPSMRSSPSPVSHYTSWPGLTDRTFTARHLPPDDGGRIYPDVNRTLDVLMRKDAIRPSERSSVLFCYFAQWFTDSFLRKHPLDPRRNTSNHEIDLCQVYGLDEPSTWALREDREYLLNPVQDFDTRIAC